MIRIEVRRVLERVRPLALTPDEILDRLPFARELLKECRMQIGVGARFAALSRVREALSSMGADIELNFDEPPGAPGPKVVFRLGQYR